MGIIYTSTCGILEGANLSGDLKNPAKSLPKGTLLAVLTSFLVYICFSILLAACYRPVDLQVGGKRSCFLVLTFSLLLMR